MNTKVTCLNDYRTVALTAVTMRCFERLVMAQINTIIPETLDPLQFVYLPNRSTDDAISIVLHTALSHYFSILATIGPASPGFGRGRQILSIRFFS
jgi:hypothetical protein